MEILKITGGIAGLAGLAIGLIALIFRDIIRKKIFPNLTNQQGYDLLRLIVILSWSTAIIGIVGWIFSGPQTGNERDRHGERILKEDVIFECMLAENGSELPRGTADGHVDGGWKVKPESWYKERYLWKIGPPVSVVFRINDEKFADVLRVKLELQHCGSGGEREATRAQILVNGNPFRDGFAPQGQINEWAHPFEIGRELLKQGENTIKLQLSEKSPSPNVWWIKAVRVSAMREGRRDR